jgi:hypothetical protein
VNRAPFDAVNGLARPEQAPVAAGVAGVVDDGVGVEDAMLLESLLAIEVMVEALDDSATEEETMDEDKLEVGDSELVAVEDDELAGVEDAMLLESLLAIEVTVEALDDPTTAEETLDEAKLETGDEELMTEDLITGGTVPASTRNPALIIVWAWLTPAEMTPLSVWHDLRFK